MEISISECRQEKTKKKKKVKQVEERAATCVRKTDMKDEAKHEKEKKSFNQVSFKSVWKVLILRKKLSRAGLEKKIHGKFRADLSSTRGWEGGGGGSENITVMVNEGKENRKEKKIH